MKTADITTPHRFGTSLLSEGSYPDAIRTQAEQRAKEKLARIIEREGDMNGARRRPEYFEQLVEEAIRESRFARFTAELYDTYKEIKEKPAAEAAGSSNYSISIVAQSF